MILQLSQYYRRQIAALYALLFCFSGLLPIAGRGETPAIRRYPPTVTLPYRHMEGIDHRDAGKHARLPEGSRQLRIGGPSQPEMSSFKSVGASNLVNLFTGDFSYNIPLMDVGGYPVNIYYDGGVTPEQEASWVGLGWNINPGNINRNVRGIPDDFNGQDTLQQLQVMKPNKTWGLDVGADAELLGIKAPVNASLGVAFNNYLGPSLDLALRGNLALNIGSIAGSEKIGASASATIGIDVNSRSGASFSGSVSLLANAAMQNNNLTFGAGLSTGYNSRTGIKSLQISEQQSISSQETRLGIHKRSGELYEYNAGGHINSSLYATSINFVKPSYTPSLRMPLTNTAWSGHFQLGLGSYGVAADVEAEVYGQQSEVAPADTLQRKPMVGYLYAQNAAVNPGYVMDFTRFNDREVTPNTPVISVPQYSYDVFSIQGEGTGGSIRAYRGDLGYVRDNVTTSKDKNISLGADIDPPGHYGANFNTIKTPTTIGEWNTGNKLRSVIPFKPASGTFENVYFRNPGENSVLDPNRYTRIGGASLVRFVLGGSGNSPSIEPKLQSFSASLAPSPSLIDLTQPITPVRNKRSQVVNFLTAAEASVAGLDTVIKNYDNQTFLDPVADTLLYQVIQRMDYVIRKPHHISQVDVTENNGRRYVYGLPVYNLLQKDFSFSVNNAYGQIPNRVLVNDPAQLTAGSPLVSSNSNRDGNVQVTTTPAYAHSFLLTGILSQDYVDVTGNGISEDDPGEAVKFNYSRIQSGSAPGHSWRAPLSINDSANFSAGLRSEVKDDKAMISYGIRESWYLQSVESKSMIALFYVSNRLDAKGALGVTGGVDTTDHFVKKLDSIALYNKADLRTGGLAKALPIKTVHFVYSYQLCQGTPDNASGIAGSQGKLTLQNIYFTYNGKTRAFKNRYSFTYNSTGSDNPADDPVFSAAAADRWGTYKPAAMNPGGLTNSEYPYTVQDSTKKAALDQQAATWMLKKIVLPSGGQLEIGYESDDYAYVQNKRAAEMMPVAGFGNTSSYSAATDRLYPYPYPSTIENLYAFVQVPVACANATEVYNRYLQGLSQVAFRLWVLMPKGPEYLTAYAGFHPGNYGVDATNHNIIWIKMDALAGYSPLSITALEYLRQQLPGQAFPGYDVSGSNNLQQVGDMLTGMLQSLRNAFTDPVKAFRKDGKAMHTDLTKCFARLNDPDGVKYGGGYRVKSVVLRDNWNTMTGQYTASYGQQYTYTTTESFQGSVRTISSGVASYEPSIGGEENPFQNMFQFQDNLPAGPTSFGAVEMPMLDAFFPAPVVGYSKVTVTTLKTDTATTKKSRSGIGRQVTEFYTARDYPVSYSYTPLDPASIKEFHQASGLTFFNKYAYDYKALSQGFLVNTNDMHGKMKSQSSYADNDSATRISYTENFYRNTGVNGMNDTFSFIDKDQGGNVTTGNMGVDIDLMTDAREFAVKSSSLELQGQVDVFYFVIPVPIPTLWKVDGVAENIYRAVTTTKVVAYHSVLDSVVVIDKGSQVSTKNLAYDAQTGEVLVTRTNNEFNQPVYSAAYPAWWAYGGMGLAYKNIDATYTGVSFSQGRITGVDQSIFESGDELLIISAAPGGGCDAQFASGARVAWAYDRNKNTTSLITTPDFIFLDKKGNPFTMANVSFRIIRSGHRNQLDAKVATVTSLDNPLASGKLAVAAGSRVLNATAVEYRELWQVDNDVIKRLQLVENPSTCSLQEVDDTTGTGYLEKSINPYRKGLLGNFKAYRSRVFYDSRKEYDTTANTTIAVGGQLNNFKLFWDFNAAGNLVPDTANLQWVWNSRINRINAKGLEVETQDALGRYTSAQYGYNKTLPVAITDNARYTEMVAENFEDYGYGEALDNTKFNSYNRQVDFSKVPNSYIANTDTCNFKAHTGRYVLGVTGVAPVSIPYQPDPGGYSLQTVSANQQSVVKGPLGGVFTNVYSGVKLDNVNTTFSQGNVLGGVYYTIQPYIPSTASPAPPVSSVNYYYMVSTKQYFQVTAGGTYILKFQSVNNFVPPSTSNTFPQFSSISVYDSVNNLTYIGTDLPTTTGPNYLTRTRSFCLPQGMYIMYLQFYVQRSYTCTPSSSSPNCPMGGSDQYLEVDNYSVMDNTTPSTTALQFFQNYTTVTGCSYTVPMAGSDSMLSKVAGVVPGKKMLFSAWVHESCGDPANGISCKVNTYTHNQVQLKFGGSGSSDVTLNPAGAIVDGWQRYEGAFVVPATATGMTMNLVNSGAGPVYFDDIRIQPFNANMKTYVYDPVNLRLLAELDANNYATLYEYDEEGILVRTKVETREGVKTVKESRSALQKVIQ